jgi:manganese transport protein
MDAALPESETASRTLSGRAISGAREVLAGRRTGLAALVTMTGPALIASVAYVDPGNFATNIQAGAHYGYTLLWVVLGANVIAMLFQAMSAKIGIVTGRNLAELSRAHFPQAVVWAMWVASEIAAMATDLAEFLGGAIGLSLLFHLPLLTGMAVTGAITYALLLFDNGGFRPLELIIGGLVAIIGVSYLAELFIDPPNLHATAAGLLVPRLPDEGAVTLAVGIVGATVMPHAIYLHSGLTQARIPVTSDADRRSLVRYSNMEVVLALTLAGAVNVAMVMMAAAAFHAGHKEVAEIETAYHTLAPLLGTAAAGIFLVSLMASGISSSVVGTMAGQVIMQGFLRWRVPVWLRRAITMLPAFIVVAAGADVTRCLVISQVILSLVLPVPMVALLLLSRRRSVMGAFVASRAMAGLAVIGTVVTIALNGVLLWQTVAGVG